jgi:ATP-dependent RNA helicase DeaD
MGFKELGLNDLLTEKLAASGIVEPTDVQSKALPQLLAGKDGVLISPTGTGKTLAYLLPLLQKIDGSRRETQAVILAPTQELAMQIMREAEAYGEPLGIKCTALIGGASLARQLERMKSKPALIVGTPGRVREVSSTRKLSFHAVIGVVVDETDRIFSLGGRSDVEFIMRNCSRDRQTVFVSATRSEPMRDAEKKWLKDPWVADVSENENENGLSSTLQHWYFLTDAREKIDLIRKLVRHLKASSALLFVNDTDKIGELLAKLRYEGFSVDALYGDTPGRERGEVMKRFRNGKTSVLIATDVAARGLDLPGLPLVIQYEPALDADHYVHRSGRTARMGKEGTTITLVTHQQRFIIDKFEKQLKIEVLPKMLFQGRVVSLEEGNVSKEPGSERKSQENRSEAKEQRPVWKSKAEYLATLNPKVEKPLAANQPASVQPSSASKPSYADRAASNGKRAINRPNASAAPIPTKPSDSSDPASAQPSVKEPAKLVGRLPAKPAGKAAAKPPVKPAKVKTDRARDLKNKGAPKWLKEKRETSPTDNK